MKPQAIQMLIPEGSPTIDCATMTYTTVAYTLEINEDSYNTETDEKGIVVDYFIEKGVPSTQLGAKGYGETRILNKCKNGVECTEEEHQENRRTTFRVISADGVLESK